MDYLLVSLLSSSCPHRFNTASNMSHDWTVMVMARCRITSMISWTWPLYCEDRGLNILACTIIVMQCVNPNTINCNSLSTKSSFSNISEEKGLLQNRKLSGNSAHHSQTTVSYRRTNSRLSSLDRPRINLLMCGYK